MGSTANKPQGGRRGGNRGGNKPSPFTSGTQAFQGGGSFWDFQPRPIAGLNQFMTGAGGVAAGLGGQGAGNIRGAQNLFTQLGRGNQNIQSAIDLSRMFSGGNLPSQFGRAEQLGNQLMTQSQQRVTGENIESSPSYQAARRAFAQSQLPLIQNQAALAGLGRSSALTNAVAAGNARAMLPIIEAELAREERGIGRGMQGTQIAMQNLLGIGGQALGANQAAVQAGLAGGGAQQGALAQAAAGLGGLGGQQFNQALQQAGLLANLGQQYRGVEQQQLDAPYQEQQRQWAEALNAMYGPLGFLGNMGGATTTQRGGKK